MKLRSLVWFGAALGVPSAALAAPIELLGVGTLPGDESDGLSLTPALLEDGVTPHDRVGGWGSALTYTGVDDLYLATPDRGPADGATSYRDRAYLLEIDATAGSVQIALADATLLVNENGEGFTGSAAAFDATGSTQSLRLDPEGVRLSGRGGFFVSDEYGPYLYEFDADGTRLGALAVPEKFAIAHPSATATAELPPGNSAGRQSNRGMEGLAIAPNGTKLFGIMQNALIQDGALDASNARVGLNNRILELDLETGQVRELVYRLESKSNGVNEITAINDHELLVLERDGKAGASAAFKRLYKVDLTGATDVSSVASLPTGALPAGVQPVAKSLFLDLLDPAFGLAGDSFPEKIEGITFGPDLADSRRLLLVSSDNDFVATQPSRVFALAIERSLLAYQPQILSPEIDLRPGDPFNHIKLRSFASLPVAIYGSALLPVSAIDKASLRLSGAGVERGRCRSSDLDRDGEQDLLCTFRTSDLQLAKTAKTIELTGTTTSGTPLQATDFVRVLGR